MNMLTEVQELVDQYGRPVMAPVCTLRNDDVEVLDVSYGMAPAQAVCNPLTGKHNDMNWISHDASGMRWRFDEVNNGFSPSLDAFYDAVVIKHLYQDWYGVPVLTEQDHKTPMKLRMLVHYGRNFENAFWDGEQMTFGDGGSMFYPLTSLDVGAHEISHGFTEQHSGIGGTDQMGALHEAFSDMAAAAAEYYTTQKNSWMIGITIAKGESPLRYMDHPSRDGMSIDNMKDYHEGINPHLLAGVFNKAFHLLANTTGWDTRKAFDVMVRANMYYWNASMKTFDEAACGVMSATADAKYSTADVVAAFSKVGIDTGKC
jgi:pseudolysin